jgi:hypothetical protein
MLVPDDASECQLEPGVVQAGYKRAEQVLANLPAGIIMYGEMVVLLRGKSCLRLLLSRNQAEHSRLDPTPL